MQGPQSREEERKQTKAIAAPYPFTTCVGLHTAQGPLSPRVLPWTCSYLPLHTLLGIPLLYTEELGLGTKPPRAQSQGWAPIHTL